MCWFANYGIRSIAISNEKRFKQYAVLVMFSKVINAVRTRISVRMAIWYSFIFIASAVAFFFIGYLLLSSSLRQKDREVIQSKLEEYSAQYQQGNLDALKAAATKD